MAKNNPSPFYPLYINGEWDDGAETLTSQNPATARDWARFAAADEERVNRAVSAARQAVDDASGEWRQMTATARGKCLSRLADLVEENAEHIAKIETQDSGKLYAETSTQTRYVADYYRYYAGLADKIQGATLPIDKPDLSVFTTREPIGVVAAVVPWNAQMFLTATKLAPALAAGCAVVIKASEVAPCAILEFARLLPQAGIPAGVVSVLTGGVEACAVPLTSHPQIDRLAFTGGRATARAVIANTANNFAVTTLELGGKSPIIVFADADVESAANGLIAGNFGASGQSCVAGSRGLVHCSLLSQLVEMISEKMRGVKIGDPLDAATQIAPLCTMAQVECAETTLAKAIEQGARLHFGGGRAPPEGLPDALRGGNFFAPTLVECPHANIETMKIEMFAPVMSLLPFDTDDEAIALANASDYGLGTGVFTRDLARAHRTAARIRSGICWVNTYRAISPIAPFGGFNQSGYGREAGLDAIADYTRTKTTWINLSDAAMPNPFIMR